MRHAVLVGFLLALAHAAYSDEVGVVCPGGQSQCPDGNTCCQLASGQWGCCPLPKAVCCSDHLHCCPNGYTCDVGAGSCSKGGLTVPWAEKNMAKPVKVESVVCPGSQAECPDGNTCCKLSSGQWGCCPLPNAVCCSDHVHCCPNGYTCSSGSCSKGDLTVPWTEKNVAKPVKVESVVCPDGQSECPDGNTCCKLASGQWGCCPLPNAVCCSDHQHCCPNGYKCDVSTGSCSKGGLTVPWAEKNVAKPVKVESVVCPDGQSECPDGNTCCKLASGQWGCCPLPNAVCCSDHVHCCPSGYTCSSGSCSRGDLTVPWTEKNVAKPVKVENVVCPGGQSECPDGNTCCKLSSGQYGCCPLPNAVCCSDHQHCCPNGYKCDVSAGSCSQGGLTVPWAEKNVAKPVEDPEKTNVTVCPGGRYLCKVNYTCCMSKTPDVYGCCHFKEATCCSDNVHCCQHGYVCDVVKHKCKKNFESIPWEEKTDAEELTTEIVPEPNVVCPGGSAQCPSGNTCCMLASGQWGCCPLPSAVCCSDHVHCCPHGYTCDVSQGTCSLGNSVLQMYKKTEATSLSTAVLPGPDVVCPGGSAQCPTGNTCCMLSSGQWGCCPLPQAVCCSDHVHCCPHGYTCDVSQGTCSLGDMVLTWYEKSEAKPLVPEPNVVCPGGSAQCPSGNTCCMLASGQWGCCPLPSAVCCSDHVHCCPNGYTCDVSQGTCSLGKMVLPWFDKTEATSLSTNNSPSPNIICPGGRYQCPTGTTCCKSNTGAYNCCPYPQAVCCADYIHCCPYGYICELSTATCHLNGLSLPWESNKEAVSLSDPAMPEPNVVCPGGSAQCPSGNTCCMLASGQWGCCPLPSAVCCSDHVHCCPHGYTCDVSQGTCSLGNMVLAWYEKTEAKPLVPESNVVCPGGSAQCPSGNTCCMLASGQWGCCPLPSAVCCNDHVHCCPHGYTCDVSQGTCSLGDMVLTWYEKTEAKPLVQEPNVVCPGGSAQCPSGNTCCMLSSGQWGCCPLPQAVCCSDHVHCCPHGYTCDVSQGTCSLGNSVLQMYKKTEATSLSTAVLPGPDVVCPGGSAQCPTGNTCCMLSSGQWGCCPLPQAVCCSDHVHCCPHGYTCDVSQETCSLGDMVLTWYEKTEAKPLVPEPNVVCPGGSAQCPSGNTCCMLASGQWGCCPLPSAVCCSDHVHCCPNGYTCDVSQGTCSLGKMVLPWFDKTEATSLSTNNSPSPNIICPGGRYQCPTGTTCCKSNTGAYNCCPYPQAVCCADYIHCCPYGYICELSTATCHLNGLSLPWESNKEAVSLSDPAMPEPNVVCPGGSAQCPSGNTCCMLASGQWGCCPLPSAVCCSDHVHCCPHGYTCDVSQGTCSLGDMVLAWYEKSEAKPVVPEPNVVCPGGSAQCPSGNTCCMLASGQWGCCPLPSAVCCSDHVHCCPHGYTCDVSQGTCSLGDMVLTWYEKTEAKPLVPEPNVVCPGGSAQCPSGNTCCMLASGQWGCCPLPSAVCCSDHVQCCPHGYTCDVSQGTCSLGNMVLAWYEKSEAKPLVPEPNVVCPGGSAQCPSGNTCCMLASGQWGCCPLPSAVCCSDHVHCCPHGYTCDVSQGTCSLGDMVQSWYEKTEAKPVVPEPNVVCPGGSAQCPSGNTCCMLASGQWGCCPLPSAVCCSDHVHCCPHGYTCDVSQGTCSLGDMVQSWYEKTEAKPLVPEPNVVCPGGSAQCPSGNTCCMLASGQWGCCPLPSAVCCSDHVHCCPHGYTCDVSQGTCSLGNMVLAWYEKSEAKPVVPEPNVVCPGGSAQCPSGNTCCMLASGQWGCCPLPSAVCCSDHVHCCPHGYTCDVSQGTCSLGNMVLTWYEKSEAKPVVPEPNVVCPGGSAQCPSGNTCCMLASGQWGCCPLPSAVCCSDHVHCCPHGYTCDVSQGTCSLGDMVLTWYKKTEAKPLVPEPNVVCPGGSAQCPSGNTCCMLASGQWGCCPLPSAVCCSDHVHCCPHGYTCDVSQGTCSLGDMVQSWYEKTEAKPLVPEPNVVCPGGSAQCPSGNTCCMLASGQWGCCPLPSAVCCSDHVHCCPHGYTCDVSQGTCSLGDMVQSWYEKTEAKPLVPEPNVVCPGGSAQCPSGNTCCMLASGQWGCCPLPSAVCCSDHVHCCPHGYTCDVSQGTCSLGDMVQSWYEKTEAKPLVPEPNVVCPGGSAQCPSGNTCCMLASGQWGCCPLPSAVCCSDHVHCCPHGYTCDVSQGTCSLGDMVQSWYEKTEAKPLVPEPNVVCPGGSAQCPSGNTCCMLASGQWGCCPLPSAVCCSDHVHCCPHGYTCDVSQGTCSLGNMVLAWYEKSEAKPVVPEPNVVCPGGSAQCPSGNTCCMLASGQWGCCPLPSAVCCSDHVHCCPHGYTCDVSQGTCSLGDMVLTWYEKTEAKPLVPEPNVVCPGGSAQCPSGNTCCMLASGQWGCCPLPSAVCCSDHVHCCPHGYTCDVSQGTCSLGDMVQSWYEKTEAKPLVPEPNVVCPGGSAQCPSGNTCCMLASGQWGCCPLPSAVCCSDHVHCCPHGYTCDVSQGTCSLGDMVQSWFEKTKASPLVPEPNVVCPGGSAQCPSGHTCCMLAFGQWGCCPLPSAVCCSDHVHCCPHGYTCDVSQGTCSLGDMVQSWYEKTEAKPLVPEPNVVCPGGSAQCPSGNTCCMLASGQWGCCPLPSAVCCSDHVHCCPHGYTCDVSQGTCSLGDMVQSWFEKTKASPLVPEPNVVCPGGSAQCPSGNTCCMLASGQWGCCPLPTAVCCSDHVHCCPHGYTCDVSQGTCSLGDMVQSWYEKTEAKPLVPEPNVVCPGGSAQCPSGNTCCMLASGQWGCCPLPSAVCCSDHVHCCPHGYTCDVSQGTCSLGDMVLTWYEKTEAKPLVPEPNVVCPGGSAQCPSGNTCCMLASGQWGCCPLPQAVCCSDHVHCCPHGYTCDVSQGTCSLGNSVLPWFEKTDTLLNFEGIVCPNSTSICKSSETCCKLKSGSWGCCPLVQAVCCSDKLHCCPKNTKCTAKNTCVGTFGSTPMVTKTQAKEIAPKPKHVPWMTKTLALPWGSKEGDVQCDATHYCPSGNTCCRLASGQWGCCPVPKAVCCSDGLHCCPSGYTCQTGTGRCVR
ncbi:uncharacterized protein LOC119745555 isoform X14 [Patiria miniata]|uniref:Granulins domain-containing protein n=1 Tax=Patiria miniata TaxID=46514 RepID=A0A914BQF0_PATMI|nr:uncharacterized protein LOC119745555 isoform X14 [Patiria miniata]